MPSDRQAAAYAVKHYRVSGYYPKQRQTDSPAKTGLDPARKSGAGLLAVMRNWNIQVSQANSEATVSGLQRHCASSLHCVNFDDVLEQLVLHY